MDDRLSAKGRGLVRQFRIKGQAPPRGVPWPLTPHGPDGDFRGPYSDSARPGLDFSRRALLRACCAMRVSSAARFVIPTFSRPLSPWLPTAARLAAGQCEYSISQPADGPRRGWQRLAVVIVRDAFHLLLDSVQTVADRHAAAQFHQPFHYGAPEKASSGGTQAAGQAGSGSASAFFFSGARLQGERPNPFVLESFDLFAKLSQPVSSSMADYCYNRRYGRPARFPRPAHWRRSPFLEEDCKSLAGSVLIRGATF